MIDFLLQTIAMYAGIQAALYSIGGLSWWSLYFLGTACFSWYVSKVG